MYRYSTGYTTINYNSDLSGDLIITRKLASASDPEPSSVSVPAQDIVKFVLNQLIERTHRKITDAVDVSTCSVEDYAENIPVIEKHRKELDGLLSMYHEVIR